MGGHEGGRGKVQRVIRVTCQPALPPPPAIIPIIFLPPRMPISDWLVGQEHVAGSSQTSHASINMAVSPARALRRKPIAHLPSHLSLSTTHPICPPAVLSSHRGLSLAPIHQFIHPLPLLPSPCLLRKLLPPPLRQRKPKRRSLPPPPLTPHTKVSLPATTRSQRRASDSAVVAYHC